MSDMTQKDCFLLLDLTLEKLSWALVNYTVANLTL